jgi:hypothetical protein
MFTSKNGIAALQIQRMMGFRSYRTAHYQRHRVRVGLIDWASSRWMKPTSAARTRTGTGASAPQARAALMPLARPTDVMVGAAHEAVWFDGFWTINSRADFKKAVRAMIRAAMMG